MYIRSTASKYACQFLYNDCAILATSNGGIYVLVLVIIILIQLSQTKIHGFLCVC